MSDGKVIIDVDLSTDKVVKEAEQAGKKIGDSLDKNVSKAVSNVEKNINKIGTSINKVNVGNLAKQFEKVDSSINKTSATIEKQKQKLEELKKAYENANNSKSQDKISQQMKNAELSIERAEKQLDKLNNKKLNLTSLKDSANGLDGNFASASMKITKDLDNIEKKALETAKVVKSIDLGEGISKVGNSISNVGDKLTMGVTLPLVGIGVAAAKVGMDFDSSMSRVSAISGATGEDFKKLHDQALQLGQDTAFSSKEAASGMESLASSGFTVNEIMSAMPGMLDLAASSGEGLASSSEIAASTIRSFGLEASQAGHVADVLAKNAATTNAQVADTGEALKYVGTNAHTAGWSLEETVAAIGDLSNYSIKGSQAGTTLREMLVRLASPSKEASDDMKAIGFNAFDSQGKMKSLSTIVSEYSNALKGKTDQQKQDLTATIFGQEAMSGMLALVQGGSGALDDLTNSYKNADGAASDMAETMQDNSKSAVEQMVGSLETTAIKVEEDFAPAIIQICNEIQNLANEFSNLSPEQQEFYVKMLMGAAAVGPLLKIIGSLTTGIGGLINVGSKIGTFFGLGTVAAEATATGTGFSGLLATLGAMTPAILPVAAALGTLGVAIAATNTASDQMEDKLTTTTDGMSNWQKAINGMTGYTFKSKKELQDLGIEYKEFGDNIGDDFKKKVEDATASINEFQLFLGKIDLDNVIDSSESSSFNNQINKMVNDAINSINSKKSETQKSLSEMFKLDDNTIDETEQKVLDSISKGFDTQIGEENKLKAEIIAIKEKAVAEKRALNDQEVKDVQDKVNKIKEIELEAVGGTQEEQDYAKNEFGARVESVSPEDAASLLTDKRKALDEENVKIKASYDTQLDTLKRNLANADEVNKGAIQTEIDKFTALRDTKLKLKNDEWQKYLSILKQKNPEALAMINTFTGGVLSKEDKLAQDRLTTMKYTYTGLSNIVKSGTYELENTQTHSMEKVTVSVDEATGKITGAYAKTTDASGNAATLIGGYTEQMANDNAKVGASSEELAAQSQQAMEQLATAHIDASGNIVNASGETVGALEDVVTENGNVVSGIYDLNGTPIKIETNADGTIKNLGDVKAQIDAIPPSKTVTINVVTNGVGAATGAIAAIGKAGGTAIQSGTLISENYTGSNSIKTGLSYVHEHGWETANNSNVKMLGNDIAFLIGNHYSGGDGINDHMTSVNEMNKEISDQINNKLGFVIAKLINSTLTQSNLLKDISNNTGETAENGYKNIQLNESLATNLVNNLKSNSGGSFANLAIEITNANNAKEKADNMKVEENANYASVKSNLDNLEGQIDDIRDKIDNTEEESVKKALQAEQKVLEKKKDTAQKEEGLAKEVAENEIKNAKNAADQQVKIAEEKKDKLTKLAEATTTAIKNQLEEEKTAAEKIINNELSQLESDYNDSIKALEEDSIDTSREDTKQEYEDSIDVLTVKMNNTASEADKRSLALQIQEKKKELSKEEDSWDLEDKKKALEEEYNAKKETYEKELKDTDNYYDKLLQEDSVNAQARYLMLKGNNNELVTLLQSYNPLWQDAGQSLADSLLNGLNSQKESIQDVVGELVGLRETSTDSGGIGIGGSGNSNNYHVAYYDDNYNLIKGYASGTTNNPYGGLYNVDEQGFELSDSNNSVAYVSQGAGILNHMQSKQFIQDEISKQVALMRASVLSEQENVKTLLSKGLTNNSNSQIIQNDNGMTLHVENLHLNTGQDVEQLANELGFYANRQRTC